MSSEPEPSMRDAAVIWHVRLRDGDAETWGKFAEWLAQDPDHAAAYDEAEALDEDIDPYLPEPRRPAVRIAPMRRAARGWRWAAGGVIVAAAVAGLLMVMPEHGTDRTEIATGPGEQKVVRLASGSSVALNGSTRLAIDGSDGKSVELIRGQALFNVVHDDRHPFTVVVGSARVVDVGTVFDVVAEDGMLRVAVSEGSVLYAASNQRQMVGRGQQLSVTGGSAARVERVGEDAIGGWQERRLIYSSASLPQVAADVGRMLGVVVAVDPSLAGRPFTGTLILPRDPAAARRRLEIALEVRIAAEGPTWSMKPGSGSQ